VRETAPTIQAAFPWIDQTRRLVSPAELQGLAHDLRPAVRDLASLTRASLDLLPQTDLASRCARDIVLPTGDEVIHDEFDTGAATTRSSGTRWSASPARARTSTATGRWCASRRAAARDARARLADVVHRPAVRQHGRRAARQPPAYPGKRPPYKPGVRCIDNRRPNLMGPASAKSDPTAPPPGVASVSRPSCTGPRRRAAPVP
jgi:hypothetical protein